MVSLFSQLASVHTPTKSLFFRSHLTRHAQPAQFSLQARRPHFVISSSSKSSSPQSHQNRQNEQPRSLFPGGYKRPEIKVPNVVLQVTPDEVLGGDGVAGFVDKAVSKWVGIVVLGGGEGSGGRLYEAAVLLKSVIRDRAYFMIAERVDIAAAVKASGVVLSDQGVPAIVARSTMMASRPESVVLPLVARSVQTENAALDASNSEGADFLIYGVDEEKHAEVLVKSVFGNVKIPIFITSAVSIAMASNLVNAGASGLVISLGDKGFFSDSVLSKLFYIGPAIKKRTQNELGSFNNKILDVDNGFLGKKRVAGFIRLEDREKQLIETERLVLLDAINIIQEAAPLVIF